MSWVIIDTEDYKINLEITDDFINFDFLNFLTNGFNSKPQKITWEMTIFFKLLNDQNSKIANYYLTDFKNTLEEKINKYKYFGVCENQTTKYCIQCSLSETKSISAYCNYEFINIEIQICKNPAFIKIKFFCFENYCSSFSIDYAKFSEYLLNHESMRKINYISLLYLWVNEILVEFNHSNYMKNLIPNREIKYNNPYSDKIDNYSCTIKMLNFTAINHWKKNLDILNSLIDYYRYSVSLSTWALMISRRDFIFNEYITKIYNLNEWIEIINK